MHCCSEVPLRLRPSVLVFSGLQIWGREVDLGICSRVSQLVPAQTSTICSSLLMGAGGGPRHLFYGQSVSDCWGEGSIS
jgi:hypothetical protein